MQKQTVQQIPIVNTTVNNEQVKKQSTKAPEQQNIILQKLQAEIQQLTAQIKELLSEQTPNQIHINGKIKKLIISETKFHNIKELYIESGQQTGQSNLQQKNLEKQLQEKISLVQKQSELYEPTLEQINQKKESMQEEFNDGWTDATQSETGTLGEDGIMVLDDDMLEQFLGKMQQKAQQSASDKSEQEIVDLEELEQEFVTGQQSDEDYLFGQHKDKFCVSVCSVLKDGLVISGGGDDNLHLYKWNIESKQQKVEEQTQKKTVQQQSKDKTNTQQVNQNKQEQITQKKYPFKSNIVRQQPFKVIPHHETIDIVDLSFDREHLFSLTEKQLMCTNLKTFQTIKIQMDPPSQITCHKQGGVFAVANAFNVEIWNIKGFKFYDSYCLDEEVNILKWALNGKQLVAACDNKLRIISPKTQQVVKASGTAFHDGQITSIGLLENTVFTGCIDGFVFATNLTKGNIMGGIPKLDAIINTLYAAQNYLMVGPATNVLYWYDSNKLKQLFVNELRGSSTDIIQLATKNQYAVSSIQGDIHLFDKRSPMKEKFIFKAGNTVHKLWHEDNTLLAACEDGCVRGWDLRKYEF